MTKVCFSVVLRQPLTKMSFIKGSLKGFLCSFSNLMLTAQASGAQVKSFLLTIYNDSNRVNIRQPAPFGVAFRMTHSVTELRCFPA